MSDSTPMNLNLDAVLAHAEQMESAPWWGLYAAEAALPLCPVCGARQVLMLDGPPQCEDVDTHPV